MKSGIYLIECGDKKYVGQAKDISKRWIQHKSELKNKTHKNIYMQRVWNKYGEDVFTFCVVEYCDVNSLNDREIFWINKLDTLAPNGMNLRQGGDVKTFTDETRKKMSESHKGKSSVKYWLGKSRSDETKQKIGNANRGEKSYWTGKTHSTEAKEKMSIASKKYWDSRKNK